MTAEGRLRRGKENYEAGKFLDNSETLAYVESITGKPILKPKEEVKPKEVKDAKPKSR